MDISRVWVTPSGRIRCEGYNRHGRRVRITAKPRSALEDFLLRYYGRGRAWRDGFSS